MAVTSVANRKGRPTADGARQKMALVLAVARELFTQLGYRAVTMRDVADKAQVSTRTLYNRYADKLSLFAACLDLGAEAFPKLPAAPKGDHRRTLEAHAAAIVRLLAQDSSVRLGMLIYREGGEFPEMLKASEKNQQRFLVDPLSAYLRAAGLAGGDAESLAQAFVAMALSEWQRRITYQHPMPSEAEIVRHAAFIVRVFLDGVQAMRDPAV